MSSRRGIATLFSRLVKRTRKAARNNVGLARPTQQLTQHVLVPRSLSSTANWDPQTFTFASGRSVKLSGRRAAETWATRAYKKGLVRGIPEESPGSCFTNTNGDTFGPGFINETGEVFMEVHLQSITLASIIAKSQNATMDLDFTSRPTQDPKHTFTSTGTATASVRHVRNVKSPNP